MPFLYNLHHQKSLRQKLRNNATPTERLLWSLLSKRQIHGYKFRRQYGIRRWVVDFYCPALRLGIEIDGDSHFVSAATRQHDLVRQERIEALGILILRFYSSDVTFQTDAVLQIIHKVVEQREKRKT